MQSHQQQRRMPQEIQPQRDDMTPEKDSSGVSTPHVFSPTHILRLQRTIGNQAVLRMAQRGRTPQVQRDPLDTAIDAAKDVGNVYEKKIEIKEDQFSASLAFAASRENTSPLKIKTEGGLTGQFGEMKVSHNTSFDKGVKTSGPILAFAMAKASYDVGELPFLPGVMFKYDVKALEAKLAIEDLDPKSLDIDLLKIAGYAEGVLSDKIEGTQLGDAILATPLGPLLRSGMVIKVTLKGEFKARLSDVRRVASMLKASGSIVKNADTAVKLAQQQQALLKRNTALWQRLATVTDKAERARLNRQLAKNTIKMRRLGRSLAENAKSTQALRGVYKEAAEGLTSRAGRVITVKVAGAAFRVLSKAIPVVGWLLAVYDVGSLLYEAYYGAQSDFEQGGAGGDGAESGATGGGDSTEGSTTESDTSASDVSQGTASNGGTSDTGSTLPGIHDLGDDVGGVSEPNAALPNVTELGDDVGGGMTDTGGAVPVGDGQSTATGTGGVMTDTGGAVPVGDDQSAATGAGGVMPKGEAKDKTNIEEIMAGIQHHKGLMEAMDQSFYLGLPPDCQKGDTYDRWFFWYGSHLVYATYTKVTILQRDENRLTIKLAPSSVYLEDGTFLPNDFEGDPMKTILLRTED